MLLLKASLVPIAALLATVSTCNSNKTITSQTKEEMLTAHEWKLDEVARNWEGQNTFYKRNGKNTTGIHYDAVRIKFNADGTGNYTTDQEDTHPLTWKMSGDRHEMTISVDYGNTTTYYWRLVEVTPDALYNTTTISDRGSNLMVTARYVPVKE